MSKYLQDVHEFHAKFKIPQPPCPQPLDVDTENFRIAFMYEELEEYETALVRQDRAGMLDALVDLVYVALGTALMHGFDFDEAWRRVHAANMTKVAGLPTGRHGSLDVSKPEGWVPPSLLDLVAHGHRRSVP